MHHALHTDPVAGTALTQADELAAIAGDHLTRATSGETDQVGPWRNLCTTSVHPQVGPTQIRQGLHPTPLRWELPPQRRRRSRADRLPGSIHQSRCANPAPAQTELPPLRRRTTSRARSCARSWSTTSVACVLPSTRAGLWRSATTSVASPVGGESNAVERCCVTDPPNNGPPGHVNAGPRPRHHSSQEIRSSGTTGCCGSPYCVVARNASRSASGTGRNGGRRHHPSGNETASLNDSCRPKRRSEDRGRR